MKSLLSFCTHRSLRQRIATRRDRLYRVALAWSGDPMTADDLVQETLEMALDKVHQLRDPERLNAWMYTIMNNRWRHHLQLRRQRPACELDEMRLISDDSPERANAQEAVVLQVRTAVARLGQGQREVLTLVDLEGFSYQEVADILGIPIGTVMSRLSRARACLQTALAQLREDMPGHATGVRRVQ